MKSLLLGLFLYIALVWVWGAYSHTGPAVVDFGLFWTAVGLIVLLVCIIGSRLWSWWRLWQAKTAGRPAAPKKPSEPVHEDDAALEALLAEAGAALAKAPAFAGKRGKSALSGLPMYLLIGPENSGKTSTFINSGLEAQLLAGRTSGGSPVVPTRLCNIWFAKDAIFVEIGGRAFSGDLGRWTQLLRGLRGKSSLPLWRRLLTEPEQGMVLHGVVGFCEATDFTGSSNPERLDQSGRDWHERLRAIGEVFGVDFPLYQAITKCDTISFFSDYFKRLPDTEANQVLGCTLAFRGEADSQPGQVFAEAEGKRLTKSFNPLYYALAGRRLTHLAHEPDPARRPQIYEFPREFKRIRSPLVEFLNALSRPDPLRPGPLLRGYYLTGVREVEVAAMVDPGATRPEWAPANLASDATQMFRGDATQIFRAGDAGKAQQGIGGRGGLTRRWIFVADLFHRVILADRRAKVAAPSDPSLDVYRMAALGVGCAVCALLCFAFLWSWTENRALMKALPAPGSGSLLSQLQSLDALRSQVETLTDYQRNGAPWKLRWGFYSGGKIVEDARKAYFRRFQQLLLNDLNGTMVARLQALPESPQANDPYEPANSVLKAHLMISSGSCKPDATFAARILKNVRQEIPPLATPEVRALADRQIDYYTSELAIENPVRVKEDIPARDRARRYLRKITGVEKVYSAILANAEKNLTKTPKLGDLASNYTQVLNGPGEVSAAFTSEGWAYIEKAAKEGSSATSSDSCVLGDLPGVAGEWKRDAETEKAIQALYVRDYVDRWKKFMAGLSVARFNGPEDAAKRLDILASHKSPLLAIFAMTANATNFQVTTPAVPEGLEKVPIVNRLITSIKDTKKTADKVVEAVSAPPTDTLTTTSDITRSFQPVHWVVPPRSESWVVEKNTAYIESLAQLRRSMEEIARGGSNPDPAVHQAAGQNRVKAMDAVRQITIGFKSIGNLGIDTEVQRLLEEPINLTKNYIIADMSKAAEGKLNAELRAFCDRFRPFLRKYPFQSTGEDATLPELATWFAPGTGAVWKLQAQTLGELTVKDGAQWKAKDPARKPQVTTEVLTFLNRAQQVTDALFAGGSPQPHFTYTLRPRLDPLFASGSIVELDIDGQLYQWTNSLQKRFDWPALPGAKESGGRARIRGSGGTSFAFASRGGLWGLFRIMGDAEPRELNIKTVEWKYLRAGDGRREPIDPAPVRLEIVEFPGGFDIFNPKFFQGLQCPMRATQ